MEHRGIPGSPGEIAHYTARAKPSVKQGRARQNSRISPMDLKPFY